MSSYFSIIVINPQDWDDFLDSQDSLPTVVTYDPTESQTPTYQASANASLQELYYRSDTGGPADGPASLTILADTVDEQGNEHRESLLYVGSMVNGQAFRFDQNQYPVRTQLY
jgi:hypothetical protein